MVYNGKLLNVLSIAHGFLRWASCTTMLLFLKVCFGVSHIWGIELVMEGDQCLLPAPTRKSKTRTITPLGFVLARHDCALIGPRRQTRERERESVTDETKRLTPIAFTAFEGDINKMTRKQKHTQKDCRKREKEGGNAHSQRRGFQPQHPSTPTVARPYIPGTLYLYFKSRKLLAAEAKLAAAAAVEEEAGAKLAPAHLKLKDRER